ncbi:maleylpyruvate isomerase N-terminal domain-containing protein [Streptomyces lavendulae]|uniref:maleylpyruvate isomerase N-terminal domain-containing protein n=1 Tax=Streptomyces lavendulae TaxID=1914 RepID=UPI0033DAE675
MADVPDTLTPAQWDAPSLCGAWRVREVAAHSPSASAPPCPASPSSSSRRAAASTG